MLAGMHGPFTAALLRLAADLRAITGGRLVWKDADAGLRRSQPRELAVQDHPACMGIKRQPDRYTRCVAWCSFQSRRPIGCGSCHAGFVQWRWPVMDGAVLMGYACLGPFARGRRDLSAPPNPALAVASGSLLCQAIAGLAGLRRQELGSLGWHPSHPSLVALLDHLAVGATHADAEMLAAQVRISPSRLQHLCRAELGVSLLTLRDRHLLGRARRLLLEPGLLPIGLIARQLCFRDQRTFATWFKRQTGSSPSAWRGRETV